MTSASTRRRAGRTAPGAAALMVVLVILVAALPAPMAGCRPLAGLEPGGGPEPPDGEPGSPEHDPADPALAISRVPIEEKLVALTFDAGSDAGHTRAILDILASHDVPATFFLTGAWLEKCSDLGLAVASAGHALGNHTYTHPHLTELTDEEVRLELERTETRALDALGRSLKPLFRPPFGEYDERVARAVARTGYTHIIMWTVDSLDWKMIPPEELTRRVLEGACPGAIVLMHVGSQTHTPEALPEIIEGLARAGYRLVTVPELLEELPAGCLWHTVAEGETLSTVAQAYGVTMADLMAANHLDDPNLVRAGEVLLIPPVGDDG